MAQKTVNKKLAFGIEGEFYDSSVSVAATYKTASQVTFGNPVWFTADGSVTGTYASGLTFAGIAVLPKEHTAATLAPTMTIPAGTTVGVASKGHIIIKAGGAIAVGDSLTFTAAGGWAVAGNGATVFGKAVIVAAAAANDLAVIEL